MIIKNNIVFQLFINLPFGEKRTETEIRKALRNKDNIEHDYFLSLYEDILDKEMKGGLKNAKGKS